MKIHSLLKNTILITLYTLCNSFACADEPKFYSQYDQDRYVYENFFKEKKHGVFVDIGAYDGISLSNSYFFETFMDWTGICIEPIPEIFTKLQANRKCLCIEGCIYDKSETAKFLKVNKTEMLSGIIDNYDPLHIQRIEQAVVYDGASVEVIEVKCYPLMQLLLDHGLRHIDYLSIDTEGGELAILQSIDFSKIEIDVIDVENNYGEPFQQFMESVGYQRAPYHGPEGSPDEIYTRIHHEIFKQ